MVYKIMIFHNLIVDNSVIRCYQTPDGNYYYFNYGNK